MGNYLHKEHAREKITRALEFFTRARERNQRFCKNRHFFATFFHFFGVIATTCIMVIETRNFFFKSTLIRTNSKWKFKNIQYLQAHLDQSLQKLDKNQVFDVNISVFCARYMRFFSKNSQILIFSMLRRKKGVVPSAAIFFSIITN